jgi:hypothetical protein
MSFSESLSQWTNPGLVVTGLTARFAGQRNYSNNGIPRPTPKFRTPTNPPQLPPSTVPKGMNIRIMRPTQQYPNGYWRMEKPMPQGGSQGINPATMRPGSQHETHIPLPPGFWK